MWEYVGPIAAVVMVLFNIGTAILAFFVKDALARMEVSLARTEKTLNLAILASQKESDDRLDEKSSEFAERIDKTTREFGEVALAIRQKITEVELFCRDTYVRRDGFYKVQENFETSIRALGDKIDARLERMEVKIDSKT